jgi:endogenous inhibitor of DNA gyrase (YacG/DUF329 family)
MSQAKVDSEGYTHVRCVNCGKSFKFLNADPEFDEAIYFCSEACRNAHFWFVGKSKFKDMFSGEIKEGKKNV